MHSLSAGHATAMEPTFSQLVCSLLRIMMCGVCVCGHTGCLTIKGMLRVCRWPTCSVPPFDGPRTCGCRFSSRFRRSLRDWESLCGPPAISILAVFNRTTFFTAAPMRAPLTGEDWWPLRMSHCSARSASLQDLLSLWYFSRHLRHDAHCLFVSCQLCPGSTCTDTCF